ncbi:porin [Rhizobium sp. L1K21]|uniref:porin n=1 Tax=Rhizobium sp. L1K21 TaxID=2954933 RepID=UPI00209275A0|nr:porin [Rhizobium sp. L1K21]MCO6187028.1 porin [Rhizobium sp. L1K21]
MTIKSLLLGSAAALAAVSGAQAADAIVAAEPEPMEYVKVCDAYGDGYFYIPGTETCLAISGFMRYDGSYNFKSKEYEGLFRARIQLDAKNDSEYGTVYSRIRFEPESKTNSRMTDATRGTMGYMGIGGLELGLYDNQFDRFFGYGGFNTLFDGYYGDAMNQYVSYTADLGALKAVVAADFLAKPNKGGYTIAASYAFGPANGALGFAYDSAVEGYTIKGSVDGEIGIVSAKLMLAYANKANYYSFESAHYGFEVLGSAQVAITDDLKAYATAGYLEKPAAFSYVSGGLAWDVASGFTTAAEVQYTYDKATKVGTTYGGLRVERSF